MLAPHPDDQVSRRTMIGIAAVCGIAFVAAAALFHLLERPAGASPLASDPDLQDKLLNAVWSREVYHVSNRSDNERHGIGRSQRQLVVFVVTRDGSPVDLADAVSQLERWAATMVDPTDNADESSPPGTLCRVMNYRSGQVTGHLTILGVITAQEGNVARLTLDIREP